MFWSRSSFFIFVNLKLSAHVIKIFVFLLLQNNSAQKFYIFALVDPSSILSLILHKVAICQNAAAPSYINIANIAINQQQQEYCKYYQSEDWIFWRSCQWNKPEVKSTRFWACRDCEQRQSACDSVVVFIYCDRFLPIMDKLSTTRLRYP